MDNIDILLKTSQFYKNEADDLLKKIKKSKTKSERLEIINKLNSLKTKISFEINEINKILEEY